MIERITKEIRKMVVNHFAYHGERVISLKKVLYGEPGDKENAVRAKVQDGQDTYFVYCSIAYNSHNEPYVYEIASHHEMEEDDEEADGA